MTHGLWEGVQQKMVKMVQYGKLLKTNLNGENSWNEFNSEIHDLDHVPFNELDQIRPRRNPSKCANQHSDDYVGLSI